LRDSFVRILIGEIACVAQNPVIANHAIGPVESGRCSSAA
jgi:hypothetical protein